MVKHNLDFYEVYGARKDHHKYIGSITFPTWVDAIRAQADYEARIPTGVMTVRYSCK